MAMAKSVQVARGTDHAVAFSGDANVARLVDVRAVGEVEAHVVLFIEGDPVAGSAFFALAVLKALVIAVQDVEVAVNTRASSGQFAFQ